MGIQNQMPVKNVNLLLMDFNVPLNLLFSCGRG